MIKGLTVLGLIVLATQGEAKADGVLLEDLFGPYLDRRDRITPGAGDAKDTNAATHVIDPWPPYVGARRIPMDGKRAAGAVQRYRAGPDAAQQSDPAASVDTPAAVGGAPDSAPPVAPAGR